MHLVTDEACQDTSQQSGICVQSRHYRLLSCSMRRSSCMVTNRFSSLSMGEKIRSRRSAPSSRATLTQSSSNSLALITDTPEGATYSDPPQKLTPSSYPTRLQYRTRQLR